MNNNCLFPRKRILSLSYVGVFNKNKSCVKRYYFLSRRHRSKQSFLFLTSNRH